MTESSPSTPLQSPAALLAQISDDYIGWLNAWHRLAFLDIEARARKNDALAPPASFLLWHTLAAKALAEDQPVLEKLAHLHEQLHTLARLVLLKTPDGVIIDGKDYDSVVAKYTELLRNLRRLERAFSVAASELDPLTGLRSRLNLHNDLARELSRSERSGRSFCVAIMDLDHFKAVNDTYGHEAGDHVLAMVANHISRGLRIHDDAYRMGGEEFLLCLKEADLTIGLRVLERLRIGIAQKPIALQNNQSLHITASFGLALGSFGMPVDELLRLADQALYRAKEEGRDRVVVAQD